MSRRHDSENEDDPEPFQSSGEEWDVEEEKKTARRKSGRVTRKPKRAKMDESGSEEADEDEEDEGRFFEEEQAKKKKKPGPKKGARPTPKKQQKVLNESDLSNDGNSNVSQEERKGVSGNESDSSKTGGNNVNVQARGVHRKFIPKTIYSEDYATGSFVIAKKDAQGGDPAKHPVIWRIDGKALLQKYEAFDEDEKVRHKNTSIYTGWSPLDKDLYAPITVDVIRHNNNNLTVEVQWDKLKVINDNDSD
ncbi:uncharacterized protein LOC126747308 isoform X4 [Anthonomus grandis grandis]|uniref:uncharacterized protein LOC126747308 isoform X1 n=1 Tax=Anthonomus grandis grandis TaxID=2921223 RepID=UPI00216616F2|nr:uncharacterized protein LOC126747308 isoform X1 [Anthonomus grandis grandis]XP_050311811.1 uncharacterized protein LOC126747308 isoform X2 [Anthonomus grandis grandis]XP_050311812.1 uncharacterized protein LOC126747308 isoform X1 [Anthonomus grandis grandis]XP_050311813.1 uncharacterized protein LOC126747308 isoform X1 [Anthonomus grandis grandis]XP_050311814.1 uncharacterized protein LOC126747308 isoform X1 [Anthonomus grandis grandis]XP_050311815.1 uncharacterized protein LOC126747308 iso